LRKAIQLKSVSGIIIKPNQNGSLIETKKVVDLAKKHRIKTIMSHRSGETMDSTIADLAVSWNCDYIKVGVWGREREAKLLRLREIEAEINK
jgi:enolase